MIRGALFKPDRLPDPGQRPIPTLLAERDLGKRCLKLLRVVSRTLDPDHDVIGAFLGPRRYIKQERQKAAFVIADMMIIDPYPGVVKHGPEADVQPVAEPILAQGKAPMIDPDPRLRAQIRKLGLPRSGNRDGAHFSRRYAVIGHVQKRPFSVKYKSIMCHGSSPVDAVRRRTARRVSRKAN